MQGIALSLMIGGCMTANAQTKGHVWGYAFGDYAYIGHGDSAGRGQGIQYKGMDNTSKGLALGQSAFDVRRVYLGYDLNINKKFTAHTLLSYEGNSDAQGHNVQFLKLAYLQWHNIFPKSDLLIGLEPTPSFGTNTEPLWGYRSVEKTIMDMRGVDGSTDLGIALAGKIWEAKADSGKHGTAIGYFLQLGNNSGSNPVPGFSNGSGPFNNTTDQARKVRFNLYLSALNDALQVGFYTDYVNYGGVHMDSTSKLYQMATQTIKGYAHYKSKWFGVGFEYFMQNMKNGEFETFAPGIGTSDTTTATRSGLSIYANGTIIQKKLGVFARYDIYNPDTKYSYSTTEGFKSALASANTYKETFITAGLDWMPAGDPKVHIMPNIWYDGISNGYGSDKLKSDNYMVYRVTFYYIFK